MFATERVSRVVLLFPQTVSRLLIYFPLRCLPEYNTLLCSAILIDPLYKGVLFESFTCPGRVADAPSRISSAPLQPKLLILLINPYRPVKAGRHPAFTSSGYVESKVVILWSLEIRKRAIIFGNVIDR